MNAADVSVTNNDNDPPPTKFYVVDDATANRTFEYGASGSAVENYALNAGNTSPRGAASNVAGDKTWVVDANRNVYVYNPSGTLLGSWSVGGFNNSAQFEGIAISGTDVWIVDAKSDKVYRYTGAASRLSGSQNAASSFALNSGNTRPQGHRHRRRAPVGRQRQLDRQGLQVHGGRIARRKLDDHLRRRQSDGHHDRSDQCQRHLDRR